MLQCNRPRPGSNPQQAGAKAIGKDSVIDRGAASVRRLAARWPNLQLMHTPVHASWLNQVEIYFSIIQRKVLTPNDFRSLAELEDRLLGFQEHYQAVAQPFEWKFTRRDLPRLLARLDAHRARSKTA